MAEPGQERLRAIWRELAGRNEWCLVDDESQFFAQVIARLNAPSDEALTDGQLTVAIRQVYNTLLHQRFRERDERAAYELWRAIFKIARKDGSSPEEASDFAQETVTRTIVKFESIKSPEAFITYSLMVLRTVRRDLRRSASQDVELQGEQGDDPKEPAVSDNSMAAVEQRVEMQNLVALVYSKVKNDLERLVLLQHILQGDEPHDIAHDLGIPAYRARVAKSRAVKHLRADPEFMAALRAISEVGDSDIRTGADDDKE